MGEMRNAYSILARKRPLRRCRHIWKENSRMDFKEIGWEGVDLFHMNQDRDQ
jgi:hypothetical protein